MKRLKKIVREIFVIPSGIFVSGLVAGEVIGKSKFVPWSMLSTTDLASCGLALLFGAIAVYLNYGMIQENRRLEKFLNDWEDE